MEKQHLSPKGENMVPAQSVRLQGNAYIDHIIIAVSVILLIGSEIWLTGAASLWAVHGLLGLPLWADIAAGMILAVPVCWASFWLVRLAAHPQKRD